MLIQGKGSTFLANDFVIIFFIFQLRENSSIVLAICIYATALHSQTENQFGQ